LADVVDFVSFHYYGPAPELADKVGQLRTAVPDKPILLTEFGLPTWNSPFFPHGHTKQEQATYYADIRRTLAQTDSAGYLAWTLYDFPSVPAAAVGLMPWRTGPQRYLGLIDRDGELKPAAFLLAEDADLEVGRPFFLARFLKPFWLMLLTTVTLSGLGVVWYVRRRRASHIKT
jgi:hypothetical protein